MIFIAREMTARFRRLFPHGKFRWVLIAVSFIGAAISVSELLVMKLFTTLVLHEGEFERSILIWAIVGFFLFFIVTRVGQFLQRNYRVKALARAFRIVGKERTSKEETREWAMAFELTNVVSQGTQLIAILAFFLLLNPYIAVINVLILIAIMQVLSAIFRKQLDVHAQLNTPEPGKRVKPAQRHGARIRAAETGGLASGAGMLVLMAALLYLSINGDITNANTLVIFLGARLQNSVINNASQSLMRYARFNSEAVTNHDET
jgi:hypothetical protein